MKILSMQLGPIMTNCYLLCDEETKTCAAVDPGADGERVAAAAEEAGCTLKCIFLTHGHYDHTGGVECLRERFPGVPVYLSARDQYPAEDRRMCRLFPVLPDVTDYDEGDTVAVGNLTVSVLATPGHSKGRTDLESGDENEMMASLARLGRLEGEYRVLPGHMDGSLLSREKEYNPFLRHALRG